MTALASLSPLLSSDWSTLRLSRLSLVDIGGGSESGVVFIRCVDTWHIYRFSSPHYHGFLRALSWHSATLPPPSPHIDINSFYESGPSSRDDSDSILQTLTLPDTRTAAGDMRRAGDGSQTMSCRHCSTHCSPSYHPARLNELLLRRARLSAFS